MLPTATPDHGSGSRPPLSPTTWAVRGRIGGGFGAGNRRMHHIAMARDSGMVPRQALSYFRTHFEYDVS